MHPRTLFAYIFLLLATLSAAAPCSAQNPGVVRLATLTDYYPQCFCAPNAPDQLMETLRPGHDSMVLEGFAWDVVRESFHAQGITIELHLVPWSRVLHYVRKGVVDAGFPAVRTPARLVEFQFSTEPLLVNSMALAVRKGERVTPGDLAGLRIGTVRNWSCGQLDNMGLNVISSDSMHQNLERLISGSVDVAFCYESSCRNLLETDPRLADIEMLPTHERREEFAFSTIGSAQGHEVLKAFDQGLRMLRQSGRLEALQNKWGRNESRPQANLSAKDDQG